MSRPRWIEATRLFFNVGTTVFGGGDPAIIILQREFSDRSWMTPDQFGIAFGLARVTPGTNLLAFAAAAGWYALGVLGAIIGVLGLTLPASVLVIWLTWAWDAGARYPLAQAVISSTVAAALGTMIGTAVILVRSQCAKRKWIAPTLITLAAFALSRIGLTPLQVIALAALAGFFWVRQ